jgi:broad specificity phosphatase PhoE
VTAVGQPSRWTAREPPATRLCLIRHAEVEERYQRIFGGRIDMELSARGRQQAEALAAYLGGRHFDGLYASPMKRVQQTIAPWIATNGLRPVTCEELREVDFGAWTGHTWEEVRERFQQSAFEWLEALEAEAISGAERPAEYKGRVAACLRDILDRHAGGTVAVACHGGVARMALAHLLDLPLPKLARFEIDYASITVVDHRPDRAEVQLLNYTPWRPML